ncbi:hypothetical protein AAG906_035844 [Vitis piasezkii]
MPKTRGGHTSAPQSSERAAPVRAPLDAPPHLADSASQSRYHTRRASATPVAPTQITPRGPPTKKAKTSGPGESSRAPRDSQSQPPSARRPRPSSPIEGNSDCRSKAFHVESYFEHTTLRQQTDLRDSYNLLERYHLIAEAFHIPYAPADPTLFRRWVPLSEWDMHSPELPEPREVPPAPSTSVPSEPVPEAASSDAPPAVPPTAEPPITIPGSEYRALLASFQTLTTTQTAIMERMDHFQTQQDQQTLILLPSSVPAEDPSYPPEDQESNASNRARFGAEMRKIWPSEANCPSKCENFAFHKSKCEFRIRIRFA